MLTRRWCGDAGDDVDTDDGAASAGADADHASDDDGVLASVMKVLERVRHACAADAQEWPAWFDLTRARACE
eukprot:8674290-Pyramimonas_sp.AAC.1